MNKKKTEGEKLGEMFANVIMQTAHNMYNAPRGKQIVKTCIDILQSRIEEIQPKKADPKYKKARYG